MIIVLFINLFTTRLVLKGLGVDDFGIYNVVCGFVSMFTFLNHSISNGIQRFYNYELGKNGEYGASMVYNTSLIIQFCIIVILLLFTESFGLWYVNVKMVIPPDRIIAANFIYQLSVLSFVFSLLSSPYVASIMAHERMDFFALISIVDSVLKLLIALSLPFFSVDHLILYGFLIFSVTVFNLCAYFIYSKKNFIELKWLRSFKKDMFKSMLSFSGWNIFGIFSDMMREQGLNMVINLFFGPVVNAARAIAYQVSSALKGFVASASTSVRPQIVQSYAQNNTKRSISLMFGLSKISIVIYIVLGCPILLETNYILRLWLGGNVPEHTDSFVIIVLMISAISNMNSALSSLVHASGQMRDYQVWGGFISLITIPAAYIALSYGGAPELAFWICLLLTALMQYVSLIIVHNIVKFSLISYLKVVVFPLLMVAMLTSIIPVVLHFLMNEGFMRLILISLSSILFSSLFFYYLALSKKEKDIVLSVVKKQVNQTKR